MLSGISRALVFMRRFFLLLLVVMGAALIGRYAVLRPKLTAVERGRRLAEANGCFACHGPEGTRGIANPGRHDRTVPSYAATMMYAKSPQEVREWVRDGVSASRSKSETWRTQRDAGALRMPAFGRRLNTRQIDDLVAFVMAMSGEEAPEDSLALAGRDRANELGCVGCHGEGGRFARPNPGSLKGYVPPWDGADFGELVSGRAEFDEWVERGVSRKLDSNPLARYFLRRAALRMPAYRKHLRSGDLDALWAYVRWLRTRPR